MEIQGYENYLIYPDGRVWSKKGKGRFLKLHSNRDGYLGATLRKNNKTKYFSVHRLIALHYIPKIEGKDFVDHIDRNRQNNEISNLRWVTKSENGQNVSFCKRNTSGHTYICKDKQNWRFVKQINNKIYSRGFKTKTEALCFKFIFLLKIKCNLIYNE